MKSKARIWVGMVTLLTAVVACVDSSDFEIKKIKGNTSLAIPLAFGSLKIQDFLVETDNIAVKVYPDGLVYLQNIRKIESNEIRKLITFSNQPLNLSIPIASGSLPASPTEVKAVSLSSALTFNFSPQKLKEIQFKNATLTVNVSLFPSNPNFPFEVEVKLANFNLNGVAFQKRISGQSSFSLADYIAVLDDNKFFVDLALIVKPHANAISIPVGTSINVGLNFSGMDFKYIKGFLGDQSTPIKPQIINVDAFASALDKSSVSFADPRFSVEVSNDYGIPVTLTFKIEARKKPSKVIQLVTNPVSPALLNSPITLGQTAVTNLAVVNAKQVTDFVPDEIYIDGNARMNQGLSTGTNFCADTSKLRIKINSEVPLFGRASGIVLADTFEVDLSSIKSSDVELAVLKTNITNELPLDAFLQIYLADSKSVITDSIFTTAQTAIVIGSKVNATGDLLTAGFYDKEISLSTDKVAKLFTAKKLIVKSVMSTVKNSSGAAIDVKFKSTYKMDLSMGLKMQLKIDRDL